MTSLDRVKTVQFGKQSATDFVTVPTLAFLEPISPPIMPPDTDRVEREVFRGDAMDSASIVGVRPETELAVELQLRGNASNDGAAMNRLTETEVGPAMDCIMGANGTDPAGAATTVTGDTGATALLNVTSDADVVAGEGVLWATTLSGVETNVVREVVSKAANVLTLDRAWTDGSPGVDTVLYRSHRWLLNEAVTSHVHAMLRVEGQDWMRNFLGCQGTLVLSGEEGKPVRFDTKWRSTDWNRATALDPAFVAPTAGSFVMNINGGLWIGAEKFMFKKWQLDLEFTVQQAASVSGPNGYNGFKVVGKKPKLTGQLYFGTGGAAVGEIADNDGAAGHTSLSIIQGLIQAGGTTAKAKGTVADTYDCALQVDNRPGACLYVRMPACELRGKPVSDNGLEMIDVTLLPRRPSTGSPLRIHLF